MKLIKQEYLFLSVLFVLSLLVRALLFAGYVSKEENYLLAFDSKQYDKIAEQITLGNGIATTPGEPNFYRLPGYPVFLAASYKLFGHDSKRAMWIQLILASLIPMLVFFLALTLFPAHLMLAKIASIIATLHLGFVLYAGIMSTESLFLLFFMLFCIFFLSAITFFWCGPDRKQSICAKLFAAGLFLGISSLIRPVGHYIMILIAVLLLLSYTTISKKITGLLTITAGWLVIVSAWLIRNYMLAGAIFFHTLPGLHFLQYSAVHAAMGYVNFGDSSYFKTKDMLFAQWEVLTKQEEQKLGRTLSEYEHYALAQKLANTTIKNNFVVFLKNSCVNMARTCCTLYSSILLHVPRGTVYEQGTSLWFKIKLYLSPRMHDNRLIPLIYWEIFIYVTTLIGLIGCVIALFLKRSFLCAALKGFPFVLLFVFLTLAYGCARLRIACEPFLIIYAVAGWLFLLKKYERE